MAIITKKVGGRSYLYLSAREGKRVVHKYLGRAGDPAVEKRTAVLREAKAVPERLRQLFWDARLEDIDVGRNAAYVIERVLQLGDLDAVEWLQRRYPLARILRVLATGRQLDPKSRNFWDIWFGLENA